MSDWRTILLVPVGVLISALLCLWLAQNQIERSGRDQQRLYLLEQRDRLSADLSNQIEQHRKLTQWLAAQPVAADDSPTAGNQPAEPGSVPVSTKVSAVSLRNHLRDQPGVVVPAGVTIVQMPGNKIVSTDDPTLKPAQVLAVDAALSALDDSDGAKPAVDLVGDGIDIWFSRALSGNANQRLLTRAELKVSTTDAMRVTFETSSKPVTDSDRIDVSQNDASRQYSISEVLNTTSPALQFSYRTDSQTDTSGFWGIVSRLFAGSGLLALVLGALAWRWQNHRHSEQRLRRRADLRESSKLLAASVHAIGQSGDRAQPVSARNQALEPVAVAINALNEQTVLASQRTQQSSREVALGLSQLRKGAGQLSDLSSKHQDLLNMALDRLTQSVNGLAEIARISDQTNGSVTKFSSQSSASVQGASQAVKGLNSARDQVRQSEKRVKGLGERVQEINQAVKKVADLSDRTGILALNASLQAAAAGPAGKEFAALADEVKRLSDSGRAATNQIASLVNAIHDEGALALTAINAAITDVVDASKQASASERSVQATHTQLESVTQDINTLTRVIDSQSGAAQALTKQVVRVDHCNDELRELISSQSSQIGLVGKQAQQLLVDVSSRAEANEP